VTEPVTEPPLLDLQSITVRYGNVPALARLTLAVRAGEITCVMGENGSGKSTLVAVLSGLRRHDEGHPVVAGDDRRHRVGTAGPVAEQLGNLAGRVRTHPRPERPPQSEGCGRGGEGGSALARGPDRLVVAEEPDPLVTVRGQVLDGAAHPAVVVAEHGVHSEVRLRPVDADHRYRPGCGSECLGRLGHDRGTALSRRRTTPLASSATSSSTPRKAWNQRRSQPASAMP